MFFDFFRRYLFSARAGALVKRISWLTVIGLTISVSSLIVVISVMTALNHSIQKRTLAVEPHLTIEVPGVRSGALLEIHPLVMKIKSEPDVKTQVYEHQDVILRTNEGHFRGGVARGLTQESLQRMMQEMHRLDAVVQRKGAPFVPEILGPGEVFLGSDLAISLGVFEGDHLMVVPPEALLLPPGEAPKFEKVIIKKIISTSLSDVDSQSLFYIRDLSLLRLQNSDSRFLGVEVWIPDPHQAEDYKLSLNSFPEANVKTWQERNSSLFLALRLEKTMITLFLGVAALIASFSMISVVILLISQKRQEIAILRTIGFSKKGVRNLFWQIGLTLSLLGLGAGLLIGSSISFYIEKNPLNVLPDVYYDSQIPAYLDGVFVLTIFIVGFLIALAGSYLSSELSEQGAPALALKAKR
jgi:lipoprotein-releasing system permease protein